MVQEKIFEIDLEFSSEFSTDSNPRVLRQMKGYFFCGSVAGEMRNDRGL